MLKILVGAALGFVAVVAAGVFLVSKVVGQDEGPVQPIAFPHTVHVQTLGLECNFCHRNVEKGAAATIPAVELCVTCHKVIGTIGEKKSAEIQKVMDAWNSNQPVNWVRVHRMPDHVRFVHEVHIRVLAERENIAPTAVCSTCHGQVETMTQVRQVRYLRMGDCVNCHKANQAPTDCWTCHY